MLKRLRQKKSQSELDKLKIGLIASIDVNINSRQVSIDNFCNLLQDFSSNNYSKYDSFFNLCIYSDLTSIDLTILLEKISLAKRDQEKKLYARIIATIIIDYLENINVLLGHDCLMELKANRMTAFLDEFKEVHKKFSNFKKENDRLLRNIRNNTFAHRTKSAVKLNDLINKINVDVIYDFGLELNGYTNDFVNLSTKVIYYIADSMAEEKK